MKNDFVIPIIFISGSGGHFLTALLITAYDNNHVPLKLGIHGDAHCTGYGQVYGNIRNINNLTNFLEIVNTNPDTKFIGFHSTNVSKVKDHFSKVIVITFEKENVDEIAKMQAIKWGVDCVNPPRDPHVTIRYHTRDLELTMDKLKVYNDQHTCVVQWDELFKLDPNILVNKLSLFTGIPVENFTIANIIKWRELSKNCLKMFP